MRRRVVPYLLAIASLALLAWIVRGHLGELGRLSEVSPWVVTALAALFLVGRGLGGELARVGLAALGHPVRLRTCVMLAMLASYTNLAVPRAGLAPGAVYLRVRHGVPVPSYLSFAVASLLVATALVGAAGVALQLGLGAPPGRGPRIGWVLVFGGVSLAATLGVMAPARLFGLLPARVRTTLAEAHAAWVRLARAPGALLRIVLIQVVTIAVRGARTFLALVGSGAEVTFTEAMLVSVFADLGMLFSVTPAALGFREGGVLIGAALAGVDPGAAVLAAVIDRLATTAATIVAGQLVVWRGLRGFWRDAFRASDADGEGPPRAPEAR